MHTYIMQLKPAAKKNYYKLENTHRIQTCAHLGKCRKCPISQFLKVKNAPGSRIAIAVFYLQ